MPRAVLVLLGGAAVVVIGAGLRSASGLVTPIVLALILAIAVAPLIGWARRRGWPSWAGIVLAMLAVYAIVGFLVDGVALSSSSWRSCFRSTRRALTSSRQTCSRR
jgi:AI-2 transport protein TqsA